MHKHFLLTFCTYAFKTKLFFSMEKVFVLQVKFILKKPHKSFECSVRSPAQRLTEVIFCAHFGALNQCSVCPTAKVTYPSICISLPTQACAHSPSSAYQKYKKQMKGNSILNSRTKPAGLDFQNFSQVSRYSKINLMQLYYQEMLALQLGRLGPSLRNLVEEEEVVQN